MKIEFYFSSPKSCFLLNLTSYSNSGILNYETVYNNPYCSQTQFNKKKLLGKLKKYQNPFFLKFFKFLKFLKFIEFWKIFLRIK
ncbi:hypothetical protein APS47_03010 [Leptospira kirschneri serovar Mozdok]|nr:hypothetical protein APS47_03010 [Leptospira kirschneri serovar Mozdok]KXZ24687.1 hypothetical protein AYB34_06885 [Leptospira sp. ZV016]KXZ29512.1 hypothetical protein AYB32_09270 [Leptospira kirschneri]OOV47550.1 hypothetical protein B1J94_15490 [Leptospira kirschneri serovar Grippotyphosa]